MERAAARQCNREQQVGSLAHRARQNRFLQTAQIRLASDVHVDTRERTRSSATNSTLWNGVARNVHHHGAPGSDLARFDGLQTPGVDNPRPPLGQQLILMDVSERPVIHPGRRQIGHGARTVCGMFRLIAHVRMQNADMQTPKPRAVQNRRARFSVTTRRG